MERLAEFPADAQDDKIDWSAIGKGEAVSFVQGQDFNCSIDKLRNRAFSAASRKKLKARTRGYTTAAGQRAVAIEFYDPQDTADSVSLGES
jgi:hypothetical protein